MFYITTLTNVKYFVQAHLKEKKQTIPLTMLVIMYNIEAFQRGLKSKSLVFKQRIGVLIHSFLI